MLALALLAGACTDAGDDEGAQPSPDGTVAALADADVVIEDSGEPQPGGRLIYGLVAETNSWDPGAGQWAASGVAVARTLFDTITTWNAEGEAVPFLAESLEEQNPEFTSWHINLREDVRFHDGTPVDATAVARSLQHAKDSPTLGSAFATVTAIEVVDPLTVQVDFSEPFAILPESLTGQAGVVAAPSMLDAGEDGARRPVGSGPFMFKEWIPGNRLVVTKNPDYWRDGLPMLDEIEFRVFTDSQARVTALLQSEIDMAEATEPGAVNRLAEEAAAGEVQVIVNTEGEGSKSMIVLNTEKAPFDDIRVRQAVAMGLDKETISQAASEGRNPPANGVFSPGTPHHDASLYPSYDRERAAALVAEYEAEVGPISFALNSPPDPDITAVAQLIQSQMGAVGIDVEIAGVEQTTLIASAVTGNYQATLFRLFGTPVPDPNYVFIHSRTIRPTGISLNVARLADPATDAALTKLLSTRDPDVKAEAYRELQAAMGQSLGLIFTLRSTAAVAADETVRGFAAWTLPDGSPGLDQSESVPMLTQVWLDR